MPRSRQNHDDTRRRGLGRPDSSSVSASPPHGDTANWREELRREYAQTLPDKLAKLGDLVAALEATPSDPAAFEPLLMAVHRLHGSAGSYGFADISRICGDWELELHQARGQGVSRAVLSAGQKHLHALRGQLGPTAVPPPPEDDAIEALLLGLRAALGREPRALLVEDDPDMSALLANLLASIQFAVTPARDAAGALRAFVPDSFDLVVSDYRLGPETAQALLHEVRAADPEVPVLVVSGEVDKGELRDLIRESVDEFQEKPLDARAFSGAAVRLLLLGSERRRTRRRGAALLELSSHVRLGMPLSELLSTFARLVPEITPFRAAMVALADADSGQLRRAAAHNWPTDAAAVDLSLDELRALQERGRQLDAAAFVAGPDAARPGAWSAGDRILVEITSPTRRWGYLLVDSPLDGRRPGDDSLRMLALLGHQLASALDNDAVYAAQMRLNFQLRFSRELVRAALGSTDAAQLKPLLTSAAVNGLGGSFAAFAERTAGGWRLDDIACKRTEDYHEAKSVPGPQAERVFSRVESSRGAFHWRAADGAVSLAGRHRTRAVLAVPVCADDVLRYVLVVEEDEQDEFDDVTVRAYAGLADQIGLILSRLHYLKYLETTSAELHAAYAKLQATHLDSLRLQGLLRESLPPATWSAVLAGAGAHAPKEREADAALLALLVDDFERLAQRLSPTLQLALVERFLGVLLPAAQAAGADCVRHGHAGLLLRFKERAAALRALPALLAQESALNAGRAGEGLPTLGLTLGAAWGPVLSGSAGPPGFTERTLTGEPVHSALRLSVQARPGSALVDARLLPDDAPPEKFGLVALSGRRTLTAGRSLALLTLREHAALYR